MGLPRELVDMVFRYLRTDWNALVSCSLTCRAFFCFARRVIHERLHVVGPRMLPTITKLTKWCWIYNRRYFRILLLADDADLVRYTRHLTVEAGQVLTPRSLRPYLPNFHKFVLLASLTLTRFDPAPFLPVFDRYFYHLSQSLRSLNLISPQGTPDSTRDFISRFRNLDDLEFNPVPKPSFPLQSHQPPPKSRHWSTSLAGTLRIVNTDSRSANSLEPLLRFPGGLHFRSLQFACSAGINTTGIIGMCSSTLESVAYTFHCRESTFFHCIAFTPHIRSCSIREHIPGVRFQGLLKSSSFRSSDRQSYIQVGRPPDLVGQGPQHHQITDVLQIRIITGSSGTRTVCSPTRTYGNRLSRLVGIPAFF